MFGALLISELLGFKWAEEIRTGASFEERL